MPLSPAARAIRKRILSCTRCSLHKSCKRPIPWSGPTPLTHSPVAVIGGAPETVEDKAGKAFVGPAGRLLQRMMTSAGLSPDYMGWLYAAACRPVMDKDPKAEALRACSPNLALQLSVLKPRFLLLVGRIAAAQFRPGIKLTESHGRPFVTPDARYIGYPIYNPIALLFGDKTRADLGPMLADDLRRFCEMVYASDSYANWPDDCQTCGAGVDRYDPQGIAFCHAHFPAAVVDQGRLFA